MYGIERSQDVELSFSGDIRRIRQYGQAYFHGD